jgi:hypothetical protein
MYCLIIKLTFTNCKIFFKGNLKHNLKHELTCEKNTQLNKIKTHQNTGLVNISIE